MNLMKMRPDNPAKTLTSGRRCSCEHAYEPMELWVPCSILMSKACLNYSITQHPHQMTQSPPLMLLSLPVTVKMLLSRYNTCRMDLLSQVSSQSPSLGFQLCDPWRWLDVDMGLIQIPATICGWEWAPTSG